MDLHQVTSKEESDMDTTSDYFEDLPIVLKKGLRKNGRTIDDLKKDIRIVKEWIQTQPHFPEIPDDNTIVNFLFMNKFSIENVKNKFDMYYTIRTLLPEFFRNKHPLQSQMQNTMDTMFWISLPKVTDEGYRVTIFHLPQANFESFDVINCLTYSYNVFEVRLHEDYTVGEIFIYDCNNVTMGHVIKITPTIVKKASIVWEDTFNNNTKQIHFINAPSYLEPIVSLAKKMMKPKMANRFHFHKKIESIYNFIPHRILPKDYGGEEMSLQELNERWRQKFCQYKERFDILGNMQIDELLRPAPLLNDEILGFYGNFKKINVD